MHVKAVIEYAGTNYFGFQIQPDRPTVQNEIQKALKKLFDNDVTVKYASRTDNGVHAAGQVISFETPYDIDGFKIQRALNDILDRKVIIKDVLVCEPGFHPRYNAKSKLYVYKILNQSANNYLLKDFVWHMAENLNWKNIRKSLKIIIGEHNFLLFSSESEHKNTQIEIFEATLRRYGNLYEISFKAPYFLTYMIRYITGFLVAVGKGKENVESLKYMLKGRGKKCCYCAPAKGLELKRIWF